MKVIGRAGKEGWTKAKAKRILLSWHTYLLRESLSRPSQAAKHTNGKFQLSCTSFGTTALPSRVWDIG
jgi:hypothetical protein